MSNVSVLYQGCKVDVSVKGCVFCLIKDVLCGIVAEVEHKVTFVNSSYLYTSAAQQMPHLMEAV